MEPPLSDGQPRVNVPTSGFAVFVGTDTRIHARLLGRKRITENGRFGIIRLLANALERLFHDTALVVDDSNGLDHVVLGHHALLCTRIVAFGEVINVDRVAIPISKSVQLVWEMV